jgi:uncharacterized protein YjiS (DUF1127 family)
MTVLTQHAHIDAQSLRASLSSMVARIQLWFDVSRQRKQLARLSDHMLEDIGVDRAQINAELRKPFWK